MASPEVPRPCRHRRCAAQPDARGGNASTGPDPARRGHSAGRAAAGVTVPLPSRGVTHQRVTRKADLSRGARSGSWWGLWRCAPCPSSGLTAHELLSRAGVCFDADAMSGLGSHRAKGDKGSQGRGWREVSGSSSSLSFAVIPSQKSLSFRKSLVLKGEERNCWKGILLHQQYVQGFNLPGLDLCGRRDPGELFTSH